MRNEQRLSGFGFGRGLRRVSFLVLCGALTACGAGGGNGEGGSEAADTLTRRQKDSLISTMPVPGAGVVGKALRAADSAKARAQRHDTLIK